METNLFVAEGLVRDHIACRQAEAHTWRRLARPHPAGPVRRLLAACGSGMVAAGKRLCALAEADQPAACEPC